MTRRVLEKLCTKRVCVDFLVHIYTSKIPDTFLQRGQANIVVDFSRTDFSRIFNFEPADFCVDLASIGIVTYFLFFFCG